MLKYTTQLQYLLNALSSEQQQKNDEFLIIYINFAPNKCIFRCEFVVSSSFFFLVSMLLKNAILTEDSHALNISSSFFFIFKLGKGVSTS